MYARRVIRQYHTKRLRARKETQRMPGVFPHSIIENLPVKISRKSVKHVSHLREHGANFLHIFSHQNIRQTGSRRNLTHIIFRSLPVITKRQLSANKVFSGAGTHVYQFVGREFEKLVPSFLLVKQITANQSDVGLTD